MEGVGGGIFAYQYFAGDCYRAFAEYAAFHTNFRKQCIFTRCPNTDEASNAAFFGTGSAVVGNYAVFGTGGYDCRGKAGQRACGRSAAFRKGRCFGGIGPGADRYCCEFDYTGTDFFGQFIDYPGDLFGHCMEFGDILCRSGR